MHPYQLWEHSLILSWDTTGRVLISDTVSCCDTSTGSFPPPRFPATLGGGEHLPPRFPLTIGGGEYTSRGYFEIYVRDRADLFIELDSAPSILPRGFEPVRRLRGPIKVILAAIWFYILLQWNPPGDVLSQHPLAESAWAHNLRCRAFLSENSRQRHSRLSLPFHMMKRSIDICGVGILVFMYHPTRLPLYHGTFLFHDTVSIYYIATVRYLIDGYPSRIVPRCHVDGMIWPYYRLLPITVFGIFYNMIADWILFIVFQFY